MEPWLGNAKATAEVLRRHDIRIKKKFGQNFLIDKNVLEKIPEAAGITKDDLDALGFQTFYHDFSSANHEIVPPYLFNANAQRIVCFALKLYYTTII